MNETGSPGHASPATARADLKTRAATTGQTRADDPALRPLLRFVAVAMPVAWLLLGTSVVLDAPAEPFVLPALFLGLVAPALVLTGRERGRAGVRALLADAVRVPRPMWWGPVAAFALPAVVWGVASATGGARPLTADLVVGFLFQLVTGALVINIWEEMAWTGFVQRRSMARWGTVGGSIVTALLFAGVHLPLAFSGADDTGDVLVGAGVLLFTGVGLRLLIAATDVWSTRSLLTAGILHAAFNATSDLVDPDHDWIRLAVTVALGVAAVAVLLRTRRLPGTGSAPRSPGR
jgi:membrane protease YdiL (CAAX protease family)